MDSRKLIALCALAAVGLTACGGDDEEPTAQLTATGSVTDAPDTAEPTTEVTEDVAGGDLVPHASFYPVPTEVGEFGDITIDGVTYFAELRSCVETLDDGSEVRAYDVFDEATGVNLEVVTVTDGSGAVAFDVYDPHDGEDGQLMYTGRFPGEAGEADRTYGEGTLDDGTAFAFGLVLFVDECGDDAIIEEVDDHGEGAAAGDTDYVRPEPTEDGDWGSMTIEGAAYGAVRRSCEDVGGHSVAQVFEVVDGQTNNTLHVEFITETGEEWSVAMYPGLGASPDDEPFARGTAMTTGGDMDHTFGEGTWEDGDAFDFSLLFGGERC